jgi:hypothetical protein
MGDEDSIRLWRWGCRDWDDPVLVAGYYPEDLPADWRLSYYANEADCALLPPQRWRRVGANEAAAWAEDVGSRFRFYLEAGDRLPSTDLLGALGERCGGVLVTAPDDVPGTTMAPVAAPEGRAWAADGRTVLCLQDRGEDLRGWRGRIERLAPWLGQWHEVSVVLEGASANPRRARELRVLAELMALA